MNKMEKCGVDYMKTKEKIIISKKEFVDIINFIYTKNKQQLKLRNVLEEMSPNCYCDAFVYSEYEDSIIKLLEKMFDDKYNDIKYFLYDSNWLFRESESDTDFPVDVKTNKYLYNSPETLYNYLVRQNKN